MMPSYQKSVTTDKVTFRVLKINRLKGTVEIEVIREIDNKNTRRTLRKGDNQIVELRVETELGV